MRSADIDKVLELRKQLHTVNARMRTITALHELDCMVALQSKVGGHIHWIENLTIEEQKIVGDTLLRVLSRKRLQIEQDLQNLYNLNEGD